MYSLFLFNVEMVNNELLNYLSGFLTQQRLEIFQKILDKRTRYLTVVLEDIFQPHNASAVLRTCDCFGIQDVHIIENRNTYEVNPDIALGSSKWLNLIRHKGRHNNTKECISKLRSDGYRIIATTPHRNDLDLDDFDIHKGKAAIFMGTELTGLTYNVLDNADEYVKIPMHGFTESFNISVSTAIILHHLTHKLHRTELDWHLSDEEKLTIRDVWTRRSLKKVELLEKRYYENIQNDDKV